MRSTEGDLPDRYRPLSQIIQLCRVFNHDATSFYNHIPLLFYDVTTFKYSLRSTHLNGFFFALGELPFGFVEQHHLVLLGSAVAGSGSGVRGTCKNRVGSAA